MPGLLLVNSVEAMYEAGLCGLAAFAQASVVLVAEKSPVIARGGYISTPQDAREYLRKASGPNSKVSACLKILANQDSLSQEDVDLMRQAVKATVVGKREAARALLAAVDGAEDNLFHL